MCILDVLRFTDQLQICHRTDISKIISMFSESVCLVVKNRFSVYCAWHTHTPSKFSFGRRLSCMLDMHTDVALSFDLNAFEYVPA